MALKDLGDFVDKLENLANCIKYKFLVDACAVSGIVCKFRGFILEHDSIVHSIEMMFLFYLNMIIDE